MKNNSFSRPPTVVVHSLAAIAVAGSLTLAGNHDDALAGERQVQSAPAATTITEAGAADPLAEHKLQAFVSAALRADALQQHWETRVRQAETIEDASRMARDAMTDIAAAIEDEGLTPAEYNAIWQATRTDPDLRQRFLRSASERRGQPTQADQVGG